MFCCNKRKSLTAKNGAIHTKKVKRTMRNQFRKPKKCELRQFFFLQTNYTRRKMRRAKAISISRRHRLNIGEDMSGKAQYEQR